MAFKDLWLRGAEVAVAHLDALIAGGRDDEAAAFLRRMADATSEGTDGATPMAGVSLDLGHGIVARDPREAAACFARAAERLARIPRPSTPPSPGSARPWPSWPGRPVRRSPASPTAPPPAHLGAR